MKKNVILYGIAISLFILTCVFFSKAYQEMRLHTLSIQSQTFIFFISASLLFVYVTVNLNRQYKKRLKQEAFIAAQDKTFQALVENSQDLIVMLDAGAKSLYRSPSAAKITGFTDEERKLLDNVEQIHPEDRERIRGYIGQMKGNPGLVIPASYRILHKEGHYVWLEGTFTSLLHDPDVAAIVVNMRDVSQRMADEEELKVREKRFSDTLANMMEGVQIIDFNWRYIYVNDALIKYSTYSKEAMVGHTVMELYPGVEQSPLYAALKRCMDQREIQQLESEFTFPNGTKRFFELRMQPVPEGIFILSVDISERKKGAEEVMRVNRLYAFTSAINQSIVHVNDRQVLLAKVCDIATGIGAFQIAWLEMLDDHGNGRIEGISGEAKAIEAIKRNEGRHYSDPVFCDTPIALAVRSGRHAVNNRILEDPKLAPLHQEFAALTIQSTVSFPIRVFGKMTGTFNLTSQQPDWFDAREIALLEEAAGDISFALENFERAVMHQRTQDLVLANERRFRALLEKSKDMKALTDARGLFTYVSPSVLLTFGYAEDEILGKFSFDFFHPDDRAALSLQRNSILQSPGSFFQFQYRVLHKAGRWIWCEGTLTNLLDEPSVQALVSNFMNITERKNLEGQKEFDARNLAALINNTHDLMWSIDTSYNLITFNRPFFASVKLLSGKELSPGDGVFSAGLSQQQQAWFKELYDRAFLGESFTALEVTERPLENVSEISFYPIRHGSQVVGTACHARDVTERRKVEREREFMMSDLVRYIKNLEQFTYVVSHNIRAPIAQILGLSNILKGPLSQSDRKRSQEYMLMAVGQLDTVINDLNKILEVRSVVGLNREDIRLDKLLEDIRRSIAGTLEQEGAVIETDFQISTVCALKSYVYSVFINLIGNAVKYRKPKVPPVIKITARRLEKQVELRFTDNGIGMDLEQYGDKVFGMYQRFHLEISGKGLGLFMVKTQVEAMNGTIQVKSQLRQGTEFIIRLPD